MVRPCQIAVVFLLAGCINPVAAEDRTVTADGDLEPKTLPHATFLRNMPTNSDKRCVGIIVVAEALLEGMELAGDGCDEAEVLAQRVYARLKTGQRVRHHRHVMLAGTPVPINSKAVLDRLSTLVAQHYKRDYTRLAKTKQGARKLIDAHYSFIATAKALDRILAADPDETVALFGTGTRVFPDGKMEETSHAFLIGRQASGRITVYDANDPGTPISCQVIGGEEGVVVEWTCRYRHTGHTTTQSYLIVDRKTAFGIMLSD